MSGSVESKVRQIKQTKENIGGKQLKGSKESTIETTNSSLDGKSVADDLKASKPSEKQAEGIGSDTQFKSEHNDGIDVDLFADPRNLPNDAASVGSTDTADGDKKAKLKADAEKRLKEFREKTIAESEDVQLTRNDVGNFVDWCLGQNNFLAYKRKKGDPDSDKMASELTSFIFGRMAGTGIGMALISTGVLSWLGIIIIAWANTPNCVMSKLKETISNGTFGLVPLDKIPNISDKLAEYAQGTIGRLDAEIQRIKNGQQRAKEILSKKDPSECVGNATGSTKQISENQHDRDITNHSSFTTENSDMRVQKNEGSKHSSPKKSDSQSVGRGKSGSTTDQKFAKTIPHTDAVKRHLSQIRTTPDTSRTNVMP